MLSSYFYTYVISIPSQTGACQQAETQQQQERSKKMATSSTSNSSSLSNLGGPNAERQMQDMIKKARGGRIEGYIVRHNTPPTPVSAAPLSLLGYWVQRPSFAFLSMRHSGHLQVFLLYP